MHAGTPGTLSIGLLLLALLPAPPLAAARSWESLGPEGGDRFMIRISPLDPGTVFVAGHHGVHRSRDAGESWELVSSPVMGRDSFLDIAFAPANAREVLVAGALTGIWYSPDEGDHWEPRSTGLPPAGSDGDLFPVTSLAGTRSQGLMAGVAPSPAGEIPPGRVYRSNDLGLTWVRHDTGIVATPGAGTGVPLLSLDAAGRAWAVVHGSGVHLYQSGSWRARNGDLPPEARQTTFLAHDPLAQDRLLLGTGSSWVWESRDGGATWSRLALPLELADLTVLPLVYTVVIDPNNADVVLVRANDSDGSNEHPLFKPSSAQRAGGGLYLSADAGTTWGRASAFAFRLAADPAEAITDDLPGVGVVRRSRTWFGTAGGRQSVYRSSDGFATVETKTKGVHSVWMNDVWVHPDPPAGGGPVVIGASEAGLFRWGGVAGEWDHSRSADSAIYTWGLASDPADRDSLFYATGNPAWTTPEMKGLYRLPLSCFEQVCSPEENQLLSSTGLWGVATSPLWPRRVYAVAQERGVLASTDGGVSWDEVNAGMTLPASVTDLMLDGDGVPRLASFRSSSGQPGADPPQPWAPRYGEAGGVYAWARAAQRWEPMAAIASAVFHLEVVREDPLEIYAASSTGVFYLRPPGTWRLISEPMVVNDVAVDPRNRTHVYAATRYGVLRTTDGGAHWSDVSEGLPVRIAYALAFDAADGSLYAATEGAGIQRLRPDPNPLSRLAANAASIDFGEVPVGSEKEVELTLTNAGEADLVVSEIDSTHADFSVQGAALPAALTPGSWMVLRVRFSAATPVARFGALVISGSAANSPLHVLLKGIGYADTGTFALTVDPRWGRWTITAPWGETIAAAGNVPAMVVPTGTYQVVWRPLAGYEVPANQPVVVTVGKGQAVQVTGVYRPLLP